MTIEDEMYDDRSLTLLKHTMKISGSSDSGCWERNMLSYFIYVVEIIDLMKEDDIFLNLINVFNCNDGKN